MTDELVSVQHLSIAHLVAGTLMTPNALRVKDVVDTFGKMKIAIIICLHTKMHVFSTNIVELQMLN